MWRPTWESNDAPSELEMRGSASSAASSARLAASISERGFERFHVRRVELQIAWNSAQLFGFRQAGVRIFGGDFGQLDGRLHQVSTPSAERSEV